MADRIDVSIEHKGATPEAKPEKPHPNTCPSCGSHYRDDELDAALWVCRQCDHHLPVKATARIRQLLDEVKAAPLDEASRARLADVHASSIKELEDGLAPELVDELERLSLPFSSETPSEAELRIAQAQLVGWLEGVFHGIQTALFAQQMAARAQLEQMRRALPPGALGPEDGQDGGHPGSHSGPYL